MATKQKAVISAERDHLREIRRLVTRGAYATVSEFVREAVAEKLARLRDGQLRDQVSRYVRKGHAEEDSDLIAAQAFGARGHRAKR
jgi:Arc/MetJ-type ribon-helix-helix transcriptional regulator